MPDVVTAKVTDAKGQVRFGKTLILLLHDFGTILLNQDAQNAGD